MVVNHLLTGMILQDSSKYWSKKFHQTRPLRKWKAFGRLSTMLHVTLMLIEKNPKNPGIRRKDFGIFPQKILLYSGMGLGSPKNPYSRNGFGFLGKEWLFG